MKNEKLAVIETGGKQYLVKEGSVIKIERIEKPEKGDIVHFDKVLLLVDSEDIKIGNPYIKGEKINGKWIREGRNKKITNLRYHSKTRYTKKHGHRQFFNEIKIEKI